MPDWIAEDYSRRSTLQKAMADQVLALLHLSGSEHVLDVGCGEGKVTVEIAARVPAGSVVGVDSSTSMIEFATAHFPSREYKNLLFRTADARSLPFCGEFDLAVSFNALHWIPREQEQALRSIQQALKAEGKAQLRLVPKGERESIEDVFEEVRSAPRWALHFEGFEDPYLHLTPEEYAELAEKSGFAVESSHTQDELWDFGTRENFYAFCAANAVKWTQLIPEPERPGFINDVLDRYAQVAGGDHTFRFYQIDIGLLKARLR